MGLDLLYHTDSMSSLALVLQINLHQQKLLLFKWLSQCSPPKSRVLWIFFIDFNLILNLLLCSRESKDLLISRCILKKMFIVTSGLENTTQAPSGSHRQYVMFSESFFMVQKVVGLQCWWEFPALNNETPYATPNVAFFLYEIC